MSNLSELLPAGAGAKSATFVASGTLASGQTVVLKSNGQVEAVTETVTSSSKGTESTFSTQTTAYHKVAYHEAEDKVVAVYRSNVVGDYGYAVVGTVSGSSITWGTPTVFNSAVTETGRIAYDATAQKMLITFLHNGSVPYAIVGTVSGTGASATITFGAKNSWISTSYNSCSITYDASVGKCLISWHGAPNYYGKSVVAIISSTSVSFGTIVIFESDNVGAISSAYSTVASRIVIAYQDNGSSDQQAIVATLSGTSTVAFGTAVQATSSYYARCAVGYDVNSDRIVVAGTDNAASRAGRAVAGVISGTSAANATITFGAEASFEPTDSLNFPSLSYDTQAKKLILVYDNETEGRVGYAVPCIVSGTSLTFGTRFAFKASGCEQPNSTYDPDTNQIITVYFISNNDGKSTAVTIGYTTTTNTSFIGITDEAISSAASGSVIVQGGVNGKVTGLTIGADYYVQTDGSLASNPIPFDIAGATYVQSFSVAAQETQPWGTRFNTDGTKMFVVGATGDDVNEYALATGFDVSTASYTQAFSVASQETNPRGLAFNTDGTKMFVVGEIGDDVNEYALSTGFNVSTASFTQAFSVTTQDTGPDGIDFNTDGTEMYIVGTAGDDVNQYTLATGFDVSTASYTSNFSVAAQETSPRGIAFSNNGDKMFIVGNQEDKVHQYTLSTLFDITTASFTESFSVAGQETGPRALTFNDTGSKMYVTGLDYDKVNQYASTSASTTVPAGRALSTTSILLEG
mgnify:CR=1 FL=1